MLGSKDHPLGDLSQCVQSLSFEFLKLAYFFKNDCVVLGK
jgi:hypothetical protein